MSQLVNSEPHLFEDANDGLAYRARFLVLELMVDILMTDRLAKLSNPVSEAISLKHEVLSFAAMPPGEEDAELRQLHDMAVMLLDQRLNTIVNRVASLEPAQLRENAKHAIR